MNIGRIVVYDPWANWEGEVLMQYFVSYDNEKELSDCQEWIEAHLPGNGQYIELSDMVSDYINHHFLTFDFSEVRIFDE